MNNILEQFNLDPIGSYVGIYEDTTPLMEQYLTEATTGTTKRNLFQKMWDLLKKIVKLILDGLKKIAAWFKSIFTKRKKSASQVASEVFADLGIKVKSATPPSTNKDGTVSDKIPTISSDGKIDYDEFLTMANDYGMKIINDGLSFDIKINHSIIGNRIEKTNDVKANIIEHNNPVNIEPYLTTVIGVCEYADEFKSMISSIEVMISNPSDENIDKAIAAHDAFAGAVVKYDKYEIKSKDIAYVTECIRSLSEVLEKANITSLQENTRAYEVFNAVLDKMAMLQYGLNTITRLISMSDRVGYKWKGTVHKPEILDKVVDGFIKAGIPSGILAYNVAYMAGPELAKYSNVSSIPMGQSRATLFPADKSIIYKFATNQYGRMANKTDMNVCELIDKANMGQYIAKVLKLETGLCVETVERATLTPEESQKKANFKQDLLNLQAKFSDSGEFHAKTKHSIADIHRDNAAYVGNRLVVLDYAQLE